LRIEDEEIEQREEGRRKGSPKRRITKTQTNTLAFWVLVFSFGCCSAEVDPVVMGKI
jgi:hypothetical protein